MRLDEVLRGMAAAIRGDTDGRCDQCRRYSTIRVVYPEGDPDGLKPSVEPSLPESLDRCPTCGWTPLVIEIVAVPMAELRHRWSAQAHV